MNSDDSRALVAAVIAGDLDVAEALWRLLNNIRMSRVHHPEVTVGPFLELFNEETHRFRSFGADTGQVAHVTGSVQSVVQRAPSGPGETNVE